MIEIKHASFLISINHESQWLADTTPEVCFVGRSNVGKSSLINYLLNRKHIAYVANKPGKTRLLNFFDVNHNQLRLVDAPGYGYAAVHHKLRQQFDKFMARYLADRTNLKLVCLLLDLRHMPSKQDQEMIAYLLYYNIPTLIVGTKLDKLKKNDIKKNIKLIKGSLPEATKEITFITTSVFHKTGAEEFWVAVSQLLHL